MQISQNKNIGFGSSPVRLPFKRLEKILDRDYQKLNQSLTGNAIVENENIPLLIKGHGSLLDKVYKENLSIMSEEQRICYQVGFLHDIYNRIEPLALSYYNLFEVEDNATRQKLAQNLLNSCRSAYNAVLEITKNYQYFYDNGMEAATKPVSHIFDMVQNQLAEITKRKNIQISTINKHLLKENTVKHLPDFLLFNTFGNLLGNAVKYTPENGQIAIQFFKKQTKSKYDLLMMSVQDSGIGIPPEEISAALIGNRASNAIKSGIPGKGYGLEKVKKTGKKYFNFNIQVKSPVNPDSKERPGTKITCPIALIKKR